MQEEEEGYKRARSFILFFLCEPLETIHQYIRQEQEQAAQCILHLLLVASIDRLLNNFVLTLISLLFSHCSSQMQLRCARIAFCEMDWFSTERIKPLASSSSSDLFFMDVIAAILCTRATRGRRRKFNQANRAKYSPIWCGILISLVGWRRAVESLLFHSDCHIVLYKASRRVRCGASCLFLLVFYIIVCF